MYHAQQWLFESEHSHTKQDAGRIVYVCPPQSM